MGEIPTVEVVAWKGPYQKWVMNAEDYDPQKHTLWRDIVEGQAGPVAENNPVPADRHMVPSVPDFVTDEDGRVTAVRIIDPEKRNARKEIPIEAYDPDAHELWSTHPRFHH